MMSAKKPTKCVPFSGNSYKNIFQIHKKGTHCVPFFKNNFSDRYYENNQYTRRLFFRITVRAMFNPLKSAYLF